MQILLDHDIAAAGEVGVFVADQRRCGQVEAGRVGGAVDKAQQIARIEIPKARDFVDDRHAGAEIVEQDPFELEAHIGTFGADMEQKVARRRGRRMDRSLDRRERFQFPWPAFGMETIPEIAADPGDARQPAVEIAESDGLDEIVKVAETERPSRARPVRLRP